MARQDLTSAPHSTDLKDLTAAKSEWGLSGDSLRIYPQYGFAFWNG